MWVDGCVQVRVCVGASIPTYLIASYWSTVERPLEGVSGTVALARWRNSYNDHCNKQSVDLLGNCEGCTAVVGRDMLGLGVPPPLFSSRSITMAAV